MSKVKFFLGQPKQVEFEAKRPMIVEESKVQSDYAENDPQAPSYILNRPFYKETVTEPLEITWDGVWGGRPYVVAQQGNDGGVVLVKISDDFFDFEKTEVISVTATVSEEEQSVPISELYVRTVDDEVSQILYEGYPLVFSVAKDMSAGDIELSKGTYFARIVGLVEEVELVTAFVSALSLSAVTYEKYHKLSNEYVDAEWMATDSKGVATKKFSLNHIADAAVLGLIEEDAFVLKLDSRVYTEKELLGSKLTFSGITDGSDTFSASFVAVLANGDSDPAPDVAIVRMLGLYSGMEFLLFSSKEEGGLYLIAGELSSFPDGTSATLEIFNAEGQTVPNKLPNKFLDMDWIPKTETAYEIIYSGELNSGHSITLSYDPRLFNEDTVLLFTVEDVSYEVRSCAGVINGKVEVVVYPLVLPSGQELEVFCIGNSVELLGYVNGYVIIQMAAKDPNPIPSYFLPVGVGSTAVVTINRYLNQGLSGYTGEIVKAWNSGSTVILEFLDNSISLLSLYLGGDGIYALGVDRYSERLYRFDPMSGNGWVLNLSTVPEGDLSIPPQIYFRALGNTEFVPTELNSTLTKGSVLPAQEGATFTAIQELRDTIGTLNQDLENRLNGGT